MSEPEATSCIKTDCTIPNGTLLRWICGLFPDLGPDARITSAWCISANSVKFEIEHTKQPTRPVGPIMLQASNVKDAEIDP